MKLHPNAKTTPHCRSLLVRCVVHHGLIRVEAAEDAGISLRTVVPGTHNYDERDHHGAGFGRAVVPSQTGRSRGSKARETSSPLDRGGAEPVHDPDGVERVRELQYVPDFEHLLDLAPDEGPQIGRIESKF